MKVIAFGPDGQPMGGRIKLNGVDVELETNVPDRLRPRHVSAPSVSAEVQSERMGICLSCDKRRHTDGDGDICVACGCGSDRRLERLVAREEGPVKWCRHPKRGSGCGWAVPV